MKKVCRFALLTLVLCLRAEGGIYTATPASPILVPAGDSFGISHSMDLTSVSGLGSSLSGLVLDVHFSDNASLALGEITGTLRLGDYSGAPHIDFTPTTYTGSSGNYVYALNTESPSVHFTGYNPHDNWTLFLANASGSSDNSLVSWSLDITAVPEPVNLALGIFSGVALLVILVRTRLVRNLLSRWQAAFVVWVNAV